MAQPGNFTPLLLYASSTPTNVPLAANLANNATGSEIAINIADKNLFFKDSGGIVNTVPIRQSSTSSNGWLSSTDWNTFNNKAPATSGTSLLYGNGSGGFSNVTIGSGISFAGGTLSATGSGGTVTSVTGTSPVVSSGGNTPAISLATAYGDTLNPYASKTANYILAAPNGSAGVPTFRALVAADIPALSYVTSVSGTGTVNGLTLTGTITSSGSLTLGGTLSGIGNSQLTNSTISGVALGGSLFNLTAGTGVSFSTGTTYNGSTAITINATGSGGTVTSVAALTLGTTGTDLSSTVANGTTTPVITLNVPTASATNRGALSAADWTTFNNKQPAGTYVTSVTGTAPVVSSGGTTPAISMAAATTSVSGYLTSTDWNTFNNKGSGSVTSVAASVPAFLSISGSPITTSGTLAITLSGTALPVLNGGTGTTTSTGTGSVVLSASPTFTGTPVFANLDATTVTAQGFGVRIRQSATSSAILQITNNSASSELAAISHDGSNLTIASNVGNTIVGTLQFADGSTQISNAVPQITVYTSGSGTYTVPTNAKYITVRMVGGGGAGGGSTGTTAGGGGGAGGYLEGIITSLSSTYAYAVGAGGGNTTFGSSLFTANAGSAGTSSSATASGGTGGSASGGSVNATGATGGFGWASSPYFNGGMGAASPFGAGGSGGGTGFGNGFAAVSYGSGGGGAVGGGGAGGGGAGVIIVTAYF